MDLRSKIIRLAHQNPALRPHLLPLLREASAGVVHFRGEEATFARGGQAVTIKPDWYRDGPVVRGDWDLTDLVFDAWTRWTDKNSLPEADLPFEDDSRRPGPPLVSNPRPINYPLSQKDWEALQAFQFKGRNAAARRAGGVTVDFRSLTGGELSAVFDLNGEQVILQPKWYHGPSGPSFPAVPNDRIDDIVARAWDEWYEAHVDPEDDRPHPSLKNPRPIPFQLRPNEWSELRAFSLGRR